MTPTEARQILLLHRPGTAEANDPQMAEALKLARRDPELGAWFQAHCAYQQAMRTKFREIEVPAHLKTRILAQPKILLPAIWWRRSMWLAAAAAVVVLLALAGVWFKPGPPDRFANFQSRMVSTALREYRMDLVTHDMTQLREFLAQRGGPADYEVSKGLARLQLTGGGLLRWRNRPVSMVCFNRGDDQMLFLFVTERSGIKDPPPETPQVANVHELQTASWSEGNKTYVLAGPAESDFLHKYF